MSPMQLISETLKRLGRLHALALEEFGAAFAADYRQCVDGVELDRAGFLRHLEALRAATRYLEVRILAAASEGGQVFTHHLVEVEKTDGLRARVEVLARFQVADGLIRRCDELTRLLAGSAADRDLGSRC